VQWGVTRASSDSGVYQLNRPLASLPLGPGDYIWFVALQTDGQGSFVAASPGWALRFAVLTESSPTPAP
ncbi:MAG: hypothetical protein ACRDHL_04405, partial [Candidatus Promineifilaceae bacterium]